MKPINPVRTQGITALEWLIAFSCIAVVGAFAGPPLVSYLSIKSELNAAAENLELALDGARQAARVNRSEVVVHLNTHPGEPGSLTYSVLTPINPHQGPDHSNQAYELPGNIRLSTSQANIRLNSSGIAEKPTQIELISVADEGVVAHLLFE